MREPRPPLHSLTGLRFFAASGVVVYHFATAWLPPGPLKNVAASGFVGVDLFFLLSGFVLSYVYRPWDGIAPRPYLAARVARILPLYVTSLVLAAPFYFSGLVERRGPLGGAARALLSTVLHLSMTHAWVGHTGVWNVPDWSLSCEWAFYLALPAVAPRLLRTRRPLRLAVVVLAAGLAPAFAYHAWRPNFVGAGAFDPSPLAGLLVFHPAFRVHEFLVGALLGRAWTLDSTRYYVRGSTAVATALLFLIFANSTGLPYIPFSNGLLIPLWALLLAGLAAGRDPIARFLATRPLVVLGDASYAIYILHVPLFAWVSRLIKYSGAALPPAVAFTLYFASLIGASIAAFHLVEAPLRSLIRTRVETWLTPHPERSREP